MAVLFTFGINDQGVARIRPDAQGLPQVFVDGSCNVLGKLDLGAVRPIPLVLYGPNVPQPDLRLPEKPSLIFNQISDADSHSTALQRCERLCLQLEGVPVINHPTSVLATTRDQVAAALAGIPGVTMPRTLRCTPSTPEDLFSRVEEAALCMPVIVRLAGDHNARSMVRIDAASDAHKLDRLPMDGRTFYITELVDAPDADGLYHKHRLVIIDGEVLLRHATFGEHWVVNSSALDFMRQNPDRGDPQAIARDLVDHRLPRARDAIAEITRRIGLDYYGIDCHVDARGQLLIYEVNANMNNLITSLGGRAFFDHLAPPVLDRLTRLVESRSGERLRGAPGSSPPG